MEDQTTEELEHREHAEHAAHEPFSAKVAVSIAILAVIAASAGSLETIEEGATLSAKNEAILLQDRATDQWNFYQAKSIKQKVYEVAAAGGGANATLFTESAKHEAEDGTEIQKEAKALEGERDAKLKESERRESRHGTITIAVTMLHVAIAIATISIIVRSQRWPWYVALALGAAGCITAAVAYS